MTFSSSRAAAKLAATGVALVGGLVVGVLSGPVYLILIGVAIFLAGIWRVCLDMLDARDDREWKRRRATTDTMIRAEGEDIIRAKWGG